MLKLILLTILFVDCKAESALKAVNVNDEEMFISYSSSPPLQRIDDTIEARSKIDFPKAAYDIGMARNVAEMIKRLDKFSKKFTMELLKEKSLKPFVAKFKGDFLKINWKSKSILQMARKLEKAGAKKNKKQLAAFESKLMVS